MKSSSLFQVEGSVTTNIHNNSKKYYKVLFGETSRLIGQLSLGENYTCN